MKYGMVGIGVKPGSVEATKFGMKLAQQLAINNHRVLVENSAYGPEHHLLPEVKLSTKEEIGECDLIATVGGDGTFLYWADMARDGVTLFPVNMGTYGFLTEFANELGIEHKISMAASGDITPPVRQFRPLYAHVHHYGDTLFAKVASNEIVLRRTSGCASTINISEKRGRLSTIHADGIIVATSSGSTAYSMSAGGPIVHPGLSCMVVTPIAPHTINSRPLVLPDNSNIWLEPIHEMMLSCDGSDYPLRPHDTVQVSMSDKVINVVTAIDDSFYMKLKNRLHWGERI